MKKFLFVTLALVNFFNVKPVRADFGLTVSITGLAVAIGLVVMPSFLDRKVDQDKIGDWEVENDIDDFSSDELGRVKIELMKIDQKLDREI